MLWFGRSLFVEKRSLFRYQLSTPLTGFVEQAGKRFGGEVLNLSTGAFFLRLSHTPSSELVTSGVSDYGEVNYAGRTISGFGQIVRIQSVAEEVSIAFLWDSLELDESSGSLINEIIEGQVSTLQTGYRDNFGF